MPNDGAGICARIGGGDVDDDDGGGGGGGDDGKRDENYDYHILNADIYH